MYWYWVEFGWIPFLLNFVHKTLESLALSEFVDFSIEGSKVSAIGYRYWHVAVAVCRKALAFCWLLVPIFTGSAHERSLHYTLYPFTWCLIEHAIFAATADVRHYIYECYRPSITKQSPGTLGLSYWNLSRYHWSTFFFFVHERNFPLCART